MISKVPYAISNKNWVLSCIFYQDQEQLQERINANSHVPFAQVKLRWTQWPASVPVGEVFEFIWRSAVRLRRGLWKSLSQLARPNDGGGIE
jgi:hypothetical protein